MYTKQETFDRVLAHMKKQGGPSLLPMSTTCAYRGVGGRMCAAGCLIPDDRYERRFETRRTDELVREKESWFGHDKYFVGVLQHAHDSSVADTDTDEAFMLSWIGHVRSIAKKRDPTLP